MNADIAYTIKQKGYVKNSTLILLAFASAFFPRLIEAVGIPAAINFLHFTTVPFACALALLSTRTTNRNQRLISQMLLFGLGLLLAVIIASALLNNAAPINAVLDYVLLTEPFILLLAIICIPMSAANTQKFRVWLIRFGFINLLLALFQGLVLRLQLQNADFIQGVFLGQGGGHVIGASVSMTFGLFYFVSAKTVPIWLRASVIIATFLHMLLADAKQVLLAFLVAWVLLLITKLQDIGNLLKYLSGLIIVSYIFLWCTHNIPAFDAFNTWARPEIYGPDGEATRLKLAAFHIIPSYYKSFLNWWLGLGPGHTVGRLGGWMLELYSNLLMPLGATVHPASKAVWTAVAASWLGDQSSMFSPLFGWAGIWGDLGVLGLAAYLFFWFVIWYKLCLDDFSKFLVLTVFIFGAIFSQLEEPGYMLFVTAVIGLRWQEKRQGL